MPKDPCVLHLRDGNARSPTSFEITVLIEDITKPGSGCLATSYPTNGLVSAHLRLSASHSMSQPAHLTSWPITTFEIYKENAGMSNLGLGKETSPASFLNFLPCGSQTGVIFFFLWLSRETWQGPRFRKLLSHTAPELWYFNSLSQPLPWEHIIMWSLVMGKPHWVSRFEPVPEVESFSFLTTLNLPHFSLFVYLFVCLLLSPLLGSFSLSWAYSPTLYILFTPERTKGRRWNKAAWVPSWSLTWQACHFSLLV